MAVSSHPLDRRGRSAPSRATGQWPERADDFSQALVLPVGLVVDRLGPASSGALILIREFLRLADRAGFTTLTEPSAAGGAGLSGGEACRILIMLSEGDAALGALIALSRAPARCIAAARRLEPGSRGHIEVPLPISDRAGCLVPRGPGQLRLRREGSGWRLSGFTRDVLSGAAIASHAAVECWVQDGGAHPVVAIVPLNRPGVRRIPAPHASGRRAGAAAALAFDALWLEPERVLDADEGGAGRLSSWLRATGHLAEALAALGVARAAHRGATRWRAEHGLAPAPSLGRLGGRLTHAERALEVLCVRLETDALGELGSVAVQALGLRRGIAQLAVALSRWALLSCGSGAVDAEGVQHMDRTRFHPEKLFRDARAGRPAPSAEDPPAARLTASPSSNRSMSWAT